MAAVMQVVAVAAGAVTLAGAVRTAWRMRDGPPRRLALVIAAAGGPLALLVYLVALDDAAPTTALGAAAAGGLALGGWWARQMGTVSWVLLPAALATAAAQVTGPLEQSDGFRVALVALAAASAFGVAAALFARRVPPASPVPASPRTLDSLPVSGLDLMGQLAPAPARQHRGAVVASRTRRRARTVAGR